ncbi:MAG: GGDEF domain-containing protein [Chloroflexi bacterium]|nr:GGDEF domain-containing protein [Chloroflexota bacterium]
MHDTEMFLDEIKIKIYKPALYIGVLTCLGVWVGDNLTNNSNIISNIFLPFFILFFSVFIFALKKGGKKYFELFEILSICLVSLYMVSIYANEIVIGIPTGILNINKYYLWMATLYVTPFVMLKPRHALIISASVLLIISALGVTFLVLSPKDENLVHNADTIIQTFLSNVFYISLFSTILHLKNKMQEVEIRSNIMHSIAHTDMLTGINNRRMLNELMDTLIHQQKPFSIVLTDIDNFKKINDTQGHIAGDQVLASFGQELQKNVRENDIVGRWGGDEFIVICPSLSEGQTHQLILRLKNKFTEIDCASFSFGIAVFKHGDTPELLIKRADSSLYEQKKQTQGWAVITSQ